VKNASLCVHHFIYYQLFLSIASFVLSEPGERDMIVIQHDIDVQWPDDKKERHRVGLVVCGQPNGHSAMAMTVAYPIGIVAEMILRGLYI
jgi:alpha-aminoadipic semialdehyde synthase